jgi:hypothetical protein
VKETWKPNYSRWNFGLASTTNSLVLGLVDAATRNPSPKSKMKLNRVLGNPYLFTAELGSQNEGCLGPNGRLGHS